jgi:hypothetical protein
MRVRWLSLVLCGVAGPGWGAGVSVSIYTNGVGSASGIRLPVGSLVRVGTFLVPRASLQSNALFLAVLESNFVEFGRTTIGTGNTNAGHLQTVLNTNATLVAGAGGTIEGDPVYLWLFNSNTVSASFQHGIYTATNANWRFPQESDIPNLTLINIRDAAVTGGVVVGGFGTGTTTNPTPAPLFNLAVLPHASWSATQFGTNRFVPAIAGDAADPDRDGANNLLEYGFGTPPLSGTGSPVVMVSRSNGVALVQFVRNTNALDASWTVESGSNLLAWSVLRLLTATNGVVQPAATSVADNQTNAPRRFFRVRVSAP